MANTSDIEERNSSVTLTCRLDRMLYDMLQADSRRKSISINSLVNGIMKKYMSWEKYAEEVGFIPLARDTVRLIFDELDEKKIQKIAAQLGRTIPRELILLMFNKTDFESIVDFIELTSSRYGMVQHKNGGDVHEMILHHDVNEKFSKFLAEALKSMAEDLSFNAKILDIDRKILSIRIKESFSR